MSDQPEAKTGRIAQIRQAYTAIHRLDPKIGWWMAGAAVLAAAATLTGPSPASAQQTWVDGAWVSDTIINCWTQQPAPGYTARVSFAGNDGQLPQVGETFYFKMEVGLPGLPCTKTPVVLPELILPAGLKYAESDRNPVRWQKVDLEDGATGWSSPASAPRAMAIPASAANTDLEALLMLTGTSSAGPS